MKLKYNFVINAVADKMVAVAVGDDLNAFGGFIKMNDIGAEIFEILKNDVTLEEAIKLMKEKHPEATEAEVTDTVTGFVNQLKEADVITE
ncbi:MAG: PqqD family protein [Clostridia bacterium]|nr:PqqD family protein [Clostridia bacterium]